MYYNNFDKDISIYLKGHGQSKSLSEFSSYIHHMPHLVGLVVSMSASHVVGCTPTGSNKRPS